MPTSPKQSAHCEQLKTGASKLEDGRRAS